MTGLTTCGRRCGVRVSGGGSTSTPARTSWTGRCCTRRAGAKRSTTSSPRPSMRSSTSRAGTHASTRRSSPGELSATKAAPADAALDASPGPSHPTHRRCVCCAQLCPEPMLQVLVSMLSLERWRRQSPARQRLLLERGRAEQRELQGAEVIDHRLGVGDIAGRTTGSAEWRRARGEMGDEVATQRAIQQQQRTHDRIISANTRTSQPHHSTDGPEKGKATGTSTAQPTPSTPAPHPSTTAAPAASSESSSSSMPSTAPPPPSVLGAPGAIDAGRAMVKLLFSRYHAQLTQGCGRPGCTNELCRSSSAFVPPPKGEDGAMAIATRCLQLTRQYRDRGLCEHVNKDSEERKTASAADATER